MRLEYIDAVGPNVTLVHKTTAPSAICPTCQQPSRRVHSRAERTVRDLPWQGIAVRWRLQLRRFFCQQANCARQTFTEPVTPALVRYARCTVRLNAALSQVGFFLGGEAGARLSAGLGMGVSPDTLLRLVRRAALPERPTPRVLGVDDWAWRKSYRYGTLLCDLERQHPVDLLPDRTADTLTAWLKAHPGVEIVSRDRAGAYAEGTREGAPEAIQVADRWHVLKNLGDALERLLNRKQKYLRQAATALAAVEVAASVEKSETAPDPIHDSDDGTAGTQAQRVSHARRLRRLARYNEIKTLHQQGVSLHQIAEQLHMSRRTVRHFLRADDFPERAQKPRPRLDRFVPYIQQRWAAGCHNAVQIWRELCAQGFRGGRSTVSDFVARLRSSLPPTERASQSRTSIAGTCAATPSPRRSAYLLLRAESERKPEEQAYCDRLLSLCPDVNTVVTLAQEFTQMVRAQKAETFDTWLVTAKESGVAELRGFAIGLQQDKAAVLAALSQPWSTGPVEGHINRLKLIKRQMYGRANFDLLRQRVLQRV